MIWLGTVTRVTDKGIFVQCRTLAGSSELGPLLSAQHRMTVAGAGLAAGGDAVTGTAVGTPVYLAGDTVAISDVQGQLSTFVILARMA